MCLYIVAGRLYCIIFSWILFWSKLFFYGSSGIIVAFKFVSCFSLLGRVRVSMKVQHGSNPQLLVCKNHNSTVYVKLVAVHALASVGLLDPHFTSFFLYFLSFSLLLSFAIHTSHLITQSSAIFGRITAIMIWWLAKSPQKNLPSKPSKSSALLLPVGPIIIISWLDGDYIREKCRLTTAEPYKKLRDL